MTAKKRWCPAASAAIRRVPVVHAATYACRSSMRLHPAGRGPHAGSVVPTGAAHQPLVQRWCITDQQHPQARTPQAKVQGPRPWARMAHTKNCSAHLAKRPTAATFAPVALPVLSPHQCHSRKPRTRLRAAPTTDWAQPITMLIMPKQMINGGVTTGRNTRVAEFVS